VAQQFAGAGNFEIELVHVLPNLPAMFWDEGHILSKDEKHDREKVVDKWIADRKAKMAPAFKKAIDTLTSKGFKPAQIATKSISDSTDVAESILEEAKDGGYQTIVMGRAAPHRENIRSSAASRTRSFPWGAALWSPLLSSRSRGR